MTCSVDLEDQLIPETRAGRLLKILFPIKKQAAELRLCRAEAPDLGLFQHAPRREAPLTSAHPQPVSYAIGRSFLVSLAKVAVGSGGGRSGERVGVAGAPVRERPRLSPQQAPYGVAAYPGGVRAHERQPLDEGAGESLRRAVGVAEPDCLGRRGHRADLNIATERSRRLPDLGTRSWSGWSWS